MLNLLNTSKNVISHVSLQLSLSLRLSMCPRSLPGETLLPRTKMVFSTTALARPRWVIPMESTGPRAHALVVPTSARGPPAGQELRRPPRRRQPSSPGSSLQHRCPRECRGNWGPVCQWTATAVDAAKAVQRGHRRLLYLKVSNNKQGNKKQHTWLNSPH